MVGVYPLAAKHIKFNVGDETRPISFRNTERFSFELAQVRHSVLNANISTNEQTASHPNSSKAKAASARARVAYLSKVISQWTPSSKFF